MQFPSMPALQGSLQNMEVHSPLARTTSLGTPSPTLLHNSSFGTPSQRMVPPQLPTYHPSAGFPSKFTLQPFVSFTFLTIFFSILLLMSCFVISGVYMMQQAHGNISPLRWVSLNICLLLLFNWSKGTLRSIIGMVRFSCLVLVVLIKTKVVIIITSYS